jgi:hypothetical protein
VGAPAAWKVTVREIATGRVTTVWPVDARELVRSGEYEVVHDPGQRFRTGVSPTGPVRAENAPAPEGLPPDGALQAQQPTTSAGGEIPPDATVISHADPDHPVLVQRGTALTDAQVEAYLAGEPPPPGEEEPGAAEPESDAAPDPAPDAAPEPGAEDTPASAPSRKSGVRRR